MKLLGKVALVTGASRGIGRAICVKLANMGAKVIINYNQNEERALETANMLLEIGQQPPRLAKFDVSDSKAVEESINKLIEEIGRIDILVNNAGITKDGLILKYNQKDLEETFAIDLFGAFYCTKACSRKMIKNRFGRIINISSVVGQMGNAGQSAYSAAKAGLEGMTKSLAKELASRNITVNIVAPGIIKTDMTSKLSAQVIDEYIKNIPLNYMGEPDDIACAVAFLASEDARYITGQTLAVNGGMYM
jgi:3-oxoacyl-[acyl-carrier protein] reductase